MQASNWSPGQVLSQYPGLFDQPWYLSHNAVTLKPSQTALQHFLTTGRDANLAPGPWLDPVWYMRSNPDVASSLGLGAMHRLLVTRLPEGGLRRAASTRYLKGSAFDHYISHGVFEGRRPHPDFDPPHYARMKGLDEDDPMGVVAHWASQGGPTESWRLENLGLLDLDWVRSARGWARLSDQDCLGRVFSEPQPRPGPLFDPEWYITVQGASPQRGQTALEHFLTRGRRANLAPGPWLDPEWYLKENPDVARAGLSAHDHFVMYGCEEHRKPHPEFDITRYGRLNGLLDDNPLAIVAHWALNGGPTRRWQLENLGLLDIGSVRSERGWAELSDEECVNRVLSEPQPRPGPLFDPGWYLAHYAAGLHVSGSALDHFLTLGRQNNASPGPWLDPTWYTELNPHATGPATMSAFDHYVQYGEAEGRAPSPDFVPRLHGRLLDPLPTPLQLTRAAWAGREPGQVRTTDPGWLRDELRHAIETDPRIGAITDKSMARGLTEVFRGDRLTERLVPILDQLAGVEVLILMPHYMLGGADRVAANVSRAVAELYSGEQVGVVATDRDIRDSIPWFPPGVRCLTLQPAHLGGLTEDESAQAVAQMILAAGPRAVINVNSRAAWVAARDYGRALSETTSMRAMLFCRDYGDDGQSGGHADEFLCSTIDVLDLIAFDNRAFIGELDQEYQLLPTDLQKMRVLYQPTTLAGSAPHLDRDVTSVLWVGRLTRQKRPDLLGEVAQMMPGLTFHVFGYPTDQQTLTRFGLAQKNVILHGSLTDLTSLNPRDYGAFLFTSDYEGLPTVVVEIGALGIPIVATGVGGVPELVAAGRGWVVPPSEDASSYVNALKEALDPGAGYAAAAQLRDHISANNSWARFVNSAQQCGLIDVPR